MLRYGMNIGDQLSWEDLQLDAKQTGHLCCPECHDQNPTIDGAGAHCNKCGWRGLKTALLSTAKMLKGDEPKNEVPVATPAPCPPATPEAKPAAPAAAKPMTNPQAPPAAKPAPPPEPPKKSHHKGHY